MNAPSDTDRVLGFLLPGRSARGRIVRLGPLLDEVLAAHAYPEPLARLLADALALCALLGATLRPDEGTVTLQAQGEGGPVRLLVADWREGALRGYVEQEKSVDLSRNTSLEGLMGEGYLAITVDQTATAERWQGIVELKGQTLAEAAEGYFNQSDQLPTIVRLAVDQAGGRWTAGGLVLQQVGRREDAGPRLHVEAESGEPRAADWSHIALLAGSVQAEELVDPALTLEALLWRLLHEEEVHVLPAQAVRKGCRCSVVHIEEVLSRFPEAELEGMRDPDGRISVDCQFCSRQFRLEISPHSTISRL
ncbi:MAG: Hsp33 family molecular chaperone HslO [Thermaurantiacus sp.]